VEMTQGRKAYLRAAYPALAFNSEAPTHINTCQHQLAIHAHTRARARARALSLAIHTPNGSLVSLASAGEARGIRASTIQELPN